MVTPTIDVVEIEADEDGIFLYLEGDFSVMCSQYLIVDNPRLRFKVTHQDQEKIHTQLNEILYGDWRH